MAHAVKIYNKITRQKCRFKLDKLQCKYKTIISIALKLEI